MIPKRTPKRVTGSSPRQNRRPGLARISRSSRSSAFSLASRPGAHRPVNLEAPGLRCASGSGPRRGRTVKDTERSQPDNADDPRPTQLDRLTTEPPRDTSMDDPSGDLLSLVPHQDQVSTKPGQLQTVATAVVDEAGGHCEEPVAYCGRDGESVGGVDGAEAAVSRTMLCPSAAQAGPGAVGEEPPREAASGPPHTTFCSMGRLSVKRRDWKRWECAVNSAARAPSGLCMHAEHESTRSHRWLDCGRQATLGAWG